MHATAAVYGGSKRNSATSISTSLISSQTKSLHVDPYIWLWSIHCRPVPAVSAPPVGTRVQGEHSGVTGSSLRASAILRDYITRWVGRVRRTPFGWASAAVGRAAVATARMNVVEQYVRNVASRVIPGRHTSCHTSPRQVLRERGPHVHRRCSSPARTGWCRRTCRCATAAAPG